VVGTKTTGPETLNLAHFVTKQKIIIIWEATPCSVLNIYRRFGIVGLKLIPLSRKHYVPPKRRKISTRQYCITSHKVLGYTSQSPL
jgi:hypothetical protein